MPIPPSYPGSVAWVWISAFFFFFLVHFSLVTNRRLGSTAHASLMHAYYTWNLQKLLSCKATSSDSMISRAMKSHTNEHTVRGRPALKVVKRFWKGSVCKAYERSTIYGTSERFEWIYHESCYAVLYQGATAINPGYRLFTLIKSIFRSVIVFLDVTVNQV